MCCRKHSLNLIFVFVCVTAKTQIINTIAGTVGVAGYSGDGGQANIAKFAVPYAVASDNTGNIFIGDWFNRVVRRIDNNGIVTTIAGTGIGGYSGDGGTALNARINTPYDIAIDNNNNIYIADIGNEVIRKINQQGIISTIAGNGSFGNGASGIGDGGPATSAPLYDALAVAVDNNGNIYIVETAKNSIRKVNSSGIISTIAGQGLFFGGYSGDGGPASQAKLNGPIDIAIDNGGNILIADLGNHVIRKIAPSGIISTIAGNGTPGYSGDGGLATLAQLNRPHGITVDNVGNIYITEDSNHVIRKINTSGIISTIAGTGTKGYSGDGGQAVNARLTIPERLAIDNAGNIYFSDYHNHTIRKVTACLSDNASSVSISSDKTIICQGEAVTFIATGVNGGSNPFYHWKINGRSAGNSSNVFSTNTLQNGDIVSCTMVSSIACTQPINSNSISVTVYPSPIVNAGPDLLINPGQSIQLQARTNSTANTFQWSPPAGLNNINVLNPTANPQVSTTYKLKAVSSNGCESYDEVKVTVYQKLFMPSAFTPNNDGLNDLFRIPPGTTMQLTAFTVFNRWGQLVFKTSDINKGWDGTINSIDAPSGIYVFLISGNSAYGKISEKGTTMLMR